MMKNQLAGLMKQAQTMQENMKAAQDAIAAMEVEGESGGGMVKIVMTGRHDVKRVTIAPALLSEDKRHARGPGRGGDERRGAQGRDGVAAENGRVDRGYAFAARVQTSVLVDSWSRSAVSRS